MHLGLEEVDYPSDEVKRLASTENFYQIYGKLLAKEKNIKKNGNEGIWKKYKGFSEASALELYEDLQEYNTGWCTASDKKTAINQVCSGGIYQGGDFYVYYSKDENNEYKIPRLAIRMDKDSIGEIRGIAPNQNIEPEMNDILNAKLIAFPNSEEYMQKVSDMKKLTIIYGKHKRQEELSQEDLRFLYELDRDIEGFGYQKDPRIEEITSSRNKKQDIAKVLGCLPEQVGLKGEPYENSKYIYYEGTIDLDNIPSTEELKLPKYAKSALYSNNITSAKDLKIPKRIWHLHLNGLLSAEGLIIPNSVQVLWLDSLTNAEGLVIPNSVKHVFLNGLICAKGLKIPASVTELHLNALTSIEGLILSNNVTFVSLRSLTTKDLLYFDFTQVNPEIKLQLADDYFTLKQLKVKIELEKERMNLEGLQETLSSMKSDNNDLNGSSRKGSINLWYILIPSITIILGIILASILY